MSDEWANLRIEVERLRADVRPDTAYNTGYFDAITDVLALFKPEPVDPLSWDGPSRAGRGLPYA